jgi:hypothetical protein
MLRQRCTPTLQTPIGPSIEIAPKIRAIRYANCNLEAAVRPQDVVHHLDFESGTQRGGHLLRVAYFYFQRDVLWNVMSAEAIQSAGHHTLCTPATIHIVEAATNESCGCQRNKGETKNPSWAAPSHTV